MFGVTLRAEDIQGLIHDLRREKYLLAADALADTSRLFLRKLDRPHNPRQRFSEYARLLVAPNRALTVVRKQVNPLLTPATRRRLDKLASTVALFSEGRPDMVLCIGFQFVPLCRQQLRAVWPIVSHTAVNPSLFRFLFHHAASIQKSFIFQTIST